MSVKENKSHSSAKFLSNYTNTYNQFLGTLIIGSLLAYSNSFRVPLIYDDYSSLVENMSIRSLRNWHDLLSLPSNPGIAWRPLANLTFAISYAMSGLNPLAHHVINLLIHVLAGLTLFGVLRNTLKSNLFSKLIQENVDFLSGAIALIWTFHPVQTQSVTYISQRTESLMGLFYLLTLYCFIRSTKNYRKNWLMLSILCCYLGSLCKEIVATAPLLILLYDRTFISKSFFQSLKTKWQYYILLSCHWILLAVLMRSLKVHGAVGYGIGISPYTYALTECQAVITYIKLSFWPYPLIFDRGPLYITTITEALPYALCLLILLVITAYMLIKQPVIGFIISAFFIILAPTTSIIPIVQVPIAENRMYLPLAAVLTFAITSLFTTLGYKLGRTILTTLFILCIILTFKRNIAYESGISIWTDSIEKSPKNSRAHNNLGYILQEDPAKILEAQFHFQEALRLKPDYAEAHTNLGMLLATQSGHLNEAIKHYETALSIDWNNAEAHGNLANILVNIDGRKNEARMHYESALSIKPFSAEFLNNYAVLLSQIPGLERKAEKEFLLSLSLKPNYAEAHNNYAVLLKKIPGKELDAIEHLRIAAKLMPNSAAIEYNLASLLETRPDFIVQSIKHYEVAIRLNNKEAKAKALEYEHLGDLALRVTSPNSKALDYYNYSLNLNPKSHTVRTKISYVLKNIKTIYLKNVDDCRAAIQADPLNSEAHFIYALLLATDPINRNEAINQYRLTLKLCPDYTEAHNNLANLLSMLPSSILEAISEYQQALSLAPNNYSIHYNLAQLLENIPSRRSEAINHYIETIRLNPSFDDANKALTRLKRNLK